MPNGLNPLRKKLRTRAFITLLCWSGLVHSNGGIVSDGSLGPPLAVFSPGINGPEQVVIPQSAGLTSGHNLFHSFSSFNVSKGQTISFAEDQKGFVDNVIARVTGKEASMINGTLRVTPEGRANFYLLNPHGVIFGNGAQIDVPGDFHVTTAHFLKFQDGGRFSAAPVHSHLSAATPSSFGFSASDHNNNVLISVSDGADLTVRNPNTAIDLVGSNIKVEHGGSINAVSFGSEVRVVAAKAGRDVSLIKDSNGYLPLPSATPQKTIAGSVDIKEGGAINTASMGHNRIGGWSYDLNLREQSRIYSESVGDQDAIASDGVHWLAHQILIADGVHAGSSIYSNNLGSGIGRPIDLKAINNISIENNSSLGYETGVKSVSKSSGDSGSLSISSGAILMHGSDHENQAYIGSLALSRGNSGAVYINSKGGILLSHDATVSTKTTGDSLAGDLSIRAGGALSVRERSVIESVADNKVDKSGGTGNVSVRAGSLDIRFNRQANEPFFTGIFNENNNYDGHSGDLSVKALGNINITGGYVFPGYVENRDGVVISGIGSLSKQKVADGAVGRIDVRSGGRIYISGIGDDIPAKMPAFLRFNDPYVLTGIYSGEYSANRDSSQTANLYDINVYADHGIGVRNGAILIGGVGSGTNPDPAISILSGGPVSIYRSTVGNATSSGLNVDNRNNPSVSISGNGVRIEDRSLIFSNAPAAEISLKSSSGIFVQSRIINYQDKTNEIDYGGPDASILYSASSGAGKISLESRGNIILKTALIGALSGSPSQSGIGLDIGIKSENITLDGASILLGGKGNQVDIAKSSISLDAQGLFPFFNIINGKLYTYGYEDKINIYLNYPKEINNIIQKQSGNKKSFSFSVSGSLFGINGVLPELGILEFGVNESAIAASCDSHKSESLGLYGRGNTKIGSPLILDNL